MNSFSTAKLRITNRQLFRVVLLILLTFGACSSPKEVTWFVTTQNRLQCCKTIQYNTVEFSNTVESRLPGDSVTVRLLDDTVAGSCSRNATVGILIANNGREPIFVPISNELEGETIKLYPWRLYYSGKRDIRLARQIQYGDLVERQDAKVRFFKLGSGQEVRLKGVIEGRWLCTPPSTLYEGYLQAELDPNLYASRSRAVRATPPQLANELTSPIGLRYDVAYTTLSFLKALPGVEQTWSDNQDTTRVTIAVPEEPASFLNSSQKVAESNVVTMVIEK